MNRRIIKYSQKLATLQLNNNYTFAPNRQLVSKHIKQRQFRRLLLRAGILDAAECPGILEGFTGVSVWEEERFLTPWNIGLRLVSEPTGSRMPWRDKLASCRNLMDYSERNFQFRLCLSTSSHDEYVFYSILKQAMTPRWFPLSTIHYFRVTGSHKGKSLPLKTNIINDPRDLGSSQAFKSAVAISRSIGGNPFQQWVLTFLRLWPFNTAPHVVVIP